MNPSTRYDFLDWLRVIAILVLLFFHSGMLFVGWGFHIQNAETIPALAGPMDIAHRLRMPLLFVIAGAGLWYGLQRRSGLKVLKERTVRLMIPVVVGMFVIVPPQVFIERLYRGQWSGGFIDFYLHRVLQLQPYPAGNFSWHHLWFIVYLFVYVLLLLPALLWWSKHQQRTHAEVKGHSWAWTAALYAFALPLGLNEALLKPLFPETHNLISDWYIFFHYLLLTISGFLIASSKSAWDQIARVRQISLGAAVLILLSALTLFDLNIISRDTPADAFIANAFTWTAILAFIGYGRRYLSFENGLLRWAREASYPVYIVHQTVMLVIAYWVIQQSWQPWTKYWVVLATTLTSSIALYQFCIRPFATMRFLFGLKTLPRARAANDAVVASSVV